MPVRRLTRDPLRFDAFGLFAQYGEKEGVSLRSPQAAVAFASVLRQSAEAAAASDTFMHGHRAEAVFERVVASLGKCLLLKREDAGGDIYNGLDDEILVPDFRVLLPPDRQVLVEVKNFSSQGDAYRKQTFDTAYVAKLERYAAAMRCELLFATYWASWRKWTIVPADVLADEGGQKVLSIVDAFPANRAGEFGDVMVGTRWPLRMRVVVDPSLQSDCDETGKTRLRVVRRELYCRDRVIDDPVERRIAMTLMSFGDWELIGPEAQCDGYRIEAFEFCCQPRELMPQMEKQGFDFAGSLAGIATAMHLAATSDEDGDPVGVRARFSPGSIGELIPHDYKDKALPLWLFTMEASAAPEAEE